jgi:UDP-N-acetylglucosamine 2-epimerase (non-hydrolysing)
MKKVLSVVGARPNFMKIAPIDRAFKKYSDQVEHIIVHTGQHYDAKMSDTFFVDLELPNPKYFLGVGSGSHAEQTARIMVEFEKVLEIEKPDLMIVVGDVNSTLACSITAIKMGIPTAHIEGGLRSLDRTMPEEINRLVTDSISEYCFITELSAKINLLKENFNPNNIFFTGNTMIDSLYFALPKAEKSLIKATLGVEAKKYALITMHRPSNVDEKEQLASLLDAMVAMSKKINIIFPMHPRTKKNLELFGFEDKVNIPEIKIIEPLGYIDFLALMRSALFVLTDSGGIQEETTVLNVPCITMRTSTERPITIEIGTNTLIQPDYDSIIRTFNKIMSGNYRNGKIPQFWDGNAAERIVDVICKNIFKLEL